MHEIGKIDTVVIRANGKEAHSKCTVLEKNKENEENNCQKIASIDLLVE